MRLRRRVMLDRRGQGRQDRPMRAPGTEASLIFIPDPAEPDRALELEWLETDGLGGFASSTVALANTRSYHAVFAPAVRPPLGRMVLWARSHERLMLDGAEVALDAHVTPAGRVHPRGFDLLERFEPRPWPRWTFALGNGRLLREQFLVHGAGDAILAYSWSGSAPVALGLRLLLAFRDHHDPGSREEAAGTVLRTREGRVGFRLRGESPTRFVESAGCGFLEDPLWV